MVEITEEMVRTALLEVVDRTHDLDLVTLGHVRNIFVFDDSVAVEVIMDTPDAYRDEIREAITNILTKIGVRRVEVKYTLQTTKPEPPPDFGPPGMKVVDHLPKINNVIAVASNKGGVGKSTVASNLACALKQLGASVAVLDMDIHGPNMPEMFNAVGERARFDKDNDGRILTINRYGIPIMSVGFFIDESDTPVVLRAPIVNKLIMEFLTEVDWPDLDYLVVDLPPGTGDIQLTISQQMPNTQMLFVTTPQTVALADVYKGVKMYQEDSVKLPVLGIVENMSYFVGEDGKRYEIFGSGGARKVSKEFGIPLFGEIPLVQKIREQGDLGKPIVEAEPDNPVSELFRQIARAVTISVARNNWKVNKEREKKMFLELDLM